ncbi:MAG TPA: DUF4062 domain-containing protein [bacterium]|jgi:hypothetical protein|nr:DUF4062 domain-containing protein [bacterium]HOH56072.1 DUF4062 domain-containing protein [Paludibacteraceae bacterium]HPY15232.1 DUF4062 domain-containing protein [bacterium]HQB09382.1 DUF4062 domain-containing protein [bacterium]HQM85724.1 DUF4062 domain-containing protein [bacterium]
MESKIQIFVSSTFNDLKSERQAAVEAILKAGHIPAGMELFIAGDKSQWEVIKKWILDSDVYMLILGGRYGSIEPKSGLSYTELEYDFAVKSGKPYFAVVIDEKELEKRIKKPGKENVAEIQNPEKLAAFRAKVLSQMSSFFCDFKDIKLCILETLPNIIKEKNIKGWIRASDVTDIYEDTKEIFDITKQNGNEQQIRSNFLKQPEGTFSIWALINENHTNDEKGWFYIVSHATNGGLKKQSNEEQKNEAYQNVWSIRRGCPNNQVFWEFWWNDGIHDSSARTTKNLTHGWHLFSVLWSKEKNFIKFFIDNEIIDTKDFKFWPKEFSDYIFVGTWPNKAKGHYFNSKIGKWTIFKKAISREKLEKHFNESKPDN